MTVDIAYRWRKQLVWGILLIAIGCVMLLERADIIDFDLDVTRIWIYWPWLLVISGVTKIIPPTTPRYFLNGMWEIFFAGWWYVSYERIWGWGFGETWPALVVAAGVGMLLRPLLDNIFVSNKEPQ